MSPPDGSISNLSISLTCVRHPLAAQENRLDGKSTAPSERDAVWRYGAIWFLVLISSPISGEMSVEPR